MMREMKTQYMGRINPMNGRTTFLQGKNKYLFQSYSKRLKRRNQGLTINQKVDDSPKPTMEIRVFLEREERKGERGG